MKINNRETKACVLHIQGMSIVRGERGRGWPELPTKIELNEIRQFITYDHVCIIYTLQHSCCQILKLCNIYTSKTTERKYSKIQPIIFHEKPGDSRDLAIFFFNPVARWGWVLNNITRPLYLHQRDPVPIIQGCFGRVRKIQTTPGIRSTDLPSRSESLYRLSYCSPQKEVQKCLNGTCAHRNTHFI